VPPLADGLAALQEKLGIKEGLDKGGEAAFAFSIRRLRMETTNRFCS
jgi:hypothetical protein